MRTSLLPHVISRRALAAALAFHAMAFVQPLRADDALAYRWSVQYLIDQSQNVFGLPQRILPRHNRGLAISPDGRFLYATYHQGYNGGGEVRKIDIEEPDYVDATKAVVRNLVSKAVAVDDKGRVFIAVSQGASGVGAAGGTVPYAAKRPGGRGDFDSAILVYDGNLRQLQHEIEAENCEGVAVTREGGSLVLYGTERNQGILKRWKLTESGGKVTDATPDGLEEGEMRIPGAKSLGQIYIDPKGRIWIADRDANLVHRVSGNRKEVDTVEIHTPMGIAGEGDRIYVTRFTEREISILDPEMKVAGTLSVPWEQLELAPPGNNRNGALSGIVVVPGRGFYVSNERGQTASQKSTYGRKDGQSDTFDKKFYTDAFNDDNEPILHAAPVSAVAQ